MQAVSEFAETCSRKPTNACPGKVIVLIKESSQLLKLESSILFWKIDSYAECGLAWLNKAPKEPDFAAVFNLGQKHSLWV